MGFTKRELIEFFDSLTELVSKENRKEAEFQIQEGTGVGEDESSYAGSRQN